MTLAVDAIGASSAAYARTPPPPETAESVARTADLETAKAWLAENPDQQEAFFTALASTRPGMIYDLVHASAQIDVAALQAVAQPAPEPSVEDRLWGGLRALGGGLETIAGGALLLAPEPTMATKVGGGVLIAHGADNAVAGMKQVFSGVPEQSLTQAAAEKAAQALGADANTAATIGVGVDVAVGLGAAGLSSAASLGSRSATVWSSIKATQPVYAGTVIPRSFELTTSAGKVWVHGNATEHMAEYATAMLGRGVNPQLVQVGSQVQLNSLKAAVDAASRGGMEYGKVIRTGGWELIFAAPREAGQLPALKHALPLR